MKNNHFITECTENLKIGRTQSCGCIKTGPKRKDYTNKKINRLLIVEFLGMTKWRDQIYKCKCDCGKNIIVKNIKSVINGKMKSCGCFNKDYRKSLIGNKHPCWNNKLTDKDRIDRRTLSDYNNWSLLVKKKDDFKCQICFGKSKEHYLISHHLESYHSNENLRYDVNNGICLCKICHGNFHKLYGYKHNTKIQFLDFAEKYQST
jgi:hypothetical protein